MSYEIHKCPNCGATLPASSEDCFYVCEYCGFRTKPVIKDPALDPSKATLIILYDAGTRVTPDLQLMISKKEDGELKKVLFGGFHNDKGEVKIHRVPNMRKLKLTLDKGEYNALFKINIYKKKMTIGLDGDKFLRIKWYALMATTAPTISPVRTMVSQLDFVHSMYGEMFSENSSKKSAADCRSCNSAMFPSVRSIGFGRKRGRRFSR